MPEKYHRSIPHVTHLFMRRPAHKVCSDSLEAITVLSISFEAKRVVDVHLHYRYIARGRWSLELAFPCSFLGIPQ